MGYVFGAAYIAVLTAAIVVAWWMIAAFFVVLLIHLVFKARENDRKRTSENQSR
jgi:hypothetical protein